MVTPKAPSQFVAEAYALDEDSDMVDFYGKWADDYDRQMVEELGYSSPALISRMLMDRLPDKKAEIFDIGCGTGLTCKLLADEGYQNLDGIDLSPDMVRVAKERDIYRDLLVGDVNLPLLRDDASYDGVISSGTFTHGHVGPEPLDEIFRILKPGGILACTVHDDLWDSMAFRSKFASIVSKGIARQIVLVRDRYYQNGDPEGWFCVYQKLA